MEWTYLGCQLCLDAVPAAHLVAQLEAMHRQARLLGEGQELTGVGGVPVALPLGAGDVRPVARLTYGLTDEGHPPSQGWIEGGPEHGHSSPTPFEPPTYPLHRGIPVNTSQE